VDIVHYDNLDTDTKQNALADKEYTVTQLHLKASTTSQSKNTNRDYVAILIRLYLILKQFDILPDRLAVPNTISYGLIFAARPRASRQARPKSGQNSVVSVM
jgi:hypothetical protein